MITKTEIFEKIYFVDNNRTIEANRDNLIMVSTKNWNHYFTKIKKTKSFGTEEIKNVRYVEFDSEDSLFEYWDKKEALPIVNLIDWSVECNYFSLLELVG